MAVAEEISILGGGIVAFPRPNDSSLHVDQVRLRGYEGSNQGIPLKGPRIVEWQPGLGRGLLRRLGTVLRHSGLGLGCQGTESPESECQSHRQRGLQGETPQWVVAQTHEIVTPGR